MTECILDAKPRTDLKDQSLSESTHILRLELHQQQLRALGRDHPACLLHFGTSQDGCLIGSSHLYITPIHFNIT